MSAPVNSWESWAKLTEVERNIDYFMDLSQMFENSEEVQEADTLYTFSPDYDYSSMEIVSNMAGEDQGGDHATHD